MINLSAELDSELLVNFLATRVRLNWTVTGDQLPCPRCPLKSIENDLYCLARPAMRAPVHFDNARSDGLIICEREDFSDYFWMADEETFDKQVLAELQEEEEMEQCMLEMLAEEEARDTTYYVVGNDNDMIPTAVIQSSLTSLPLAIWTQDQQQQQPLLQPTAAAIPVQEHDMVTGTSSNSTEILSVSQLNPEANEFVPSRSAHPVSPIASSSLVEAEVSVSSSLSSPDSTSSKTGSLEAPDR